MCTSQIHTKSDRTRLMTSTYFMRSRIRGTTLTFSLAEDAVSKKDAGGVES